MSDENMNDNDTVKNKKSEKAELISNFFFSFFFTFFVLIVIGQAALHFMGFSLLNVQTGSMSPKIPVNTLIFVQSTDPAEIREGDVITFVINQQGTLATHRVIKINSGSRTFVTKGDANNTDDGNISWDNVVGVVRFKIPKIDQKKNAFRRNEQIALTVKKARKVADVYFVGYERRFVMTGKESAQAVNSVIE